MSARVLVFGAMHFRPESMGTFAGVEQLDPSGVDFAIKSMRGAWRYLAITAERVHATLQELPGQLDAVDALLDVGAIGGDEPTAADFQLGSSLHLLVQIADVSQRSGSRRRCPTSPGSSGSCRRRAGRSARWIHAPGRFT